MHILFVAISLSLLHLMNELYSYFFLYEIFIFTKFKMRDIRLYYLKELIPKLRAWLSRSFLILTGVYWGYIGGYIGGYIYLFLNYYNSNLLHQLTLSLYSQRILWKLGWLVPPITLYLILFVIQLTQKRFNFVGVYEAQRTLDWTEL